MDTDQSRIFEDHESAGSSAATRNTWRLFFGIFLLATAYRLHAAYNSVNGLLDITSPAQALTDSIILLDFGLSLLIIRPLLRKARYAWILAAILIVQRIATNLPVLCLMWLKLGAPFQFILPMLGTTLISGCVLFFMLKSSVCTQYGIDSRRTWIALVAGVATGLAHLGSSVFLIYWGSA